MSRYFQLGLVLLYVLLSVLSVLIGLIVSGVRIPDVIRLLAMPFGVMVCFGLAYVRHLRRGDAIDEQAFILAGLPLRIIIYICWGMWRVLRVFPVGGVLLLVLLSGLLFIFHCAGIILAMLFLYLLNLVFGLLLRLLKRMW
jgi:hypothetical protein